MKYENLLRLLENETVFRTGILLTGQHSPSNVRRQLDRWVKTEKIVMLRRGVYAVAPPFARRQSHPFALANAMRQASYVSLQSALAHYGMIPEYTPVTTSVTTCRPEDLTTPLGQFVFRHVKRDMFFGMRQEEVAPEQFARLASPEKALVDLLYLTPDSDSAAYLDELRIEAVPALNRLLLRETADRCGSAKVRRAIRRLEALWRDLPEERVL